MKQVVSRTSTYSSDEFGVCSALYELGGMVVIHDASGCNSTYTTHDEPRWYDMDSMIYISAISEMEAIMGDDQKFIDDLVETASELQPKFIAIVGAPIPYMIGTDLQAIANQVELQCNIPTFSFATNGMEYYTRGVSMALVELTKRYVLSQVESDPGNADPIADICLNQKVNTKTNAKINTKTNTNTNTKVNILGATPLDFSINTTMDSIKKWIRDNDMEVGACFAMGSSLEDIAKAGESDVNLVISTGGLAAAKLMEEELAIPYVVGVPYGEVFAAALAGRLKEKGLSKKAAQAYDSGTVTDPKLLIIGEAVTSASLAEAIRLEHGVNPKVLCPLGDELLRAGDLFTPEEDDIMAAVRTADIVIADPLYKVICGDVKFYDLPHVAFSGRINETKIPDLIGIRLC